MQKHILVVDDDITALDIVSYLFEERGYRVDRCADGPSAIEHIKKESPDLIVVDLMMPRMNGVVTVSEMRTLGVKSPIIAFTAVHEGALHDEAKKAGCDDVLTKPYRPDEFINHVVEFIPNRERDTSNR